MCNQVYKEIQELIRTNIKDWRKEAKKYGQVDLTVAVDDDVTRWNYQTGDNSYIGGAYGLPNWAVTTIYKESTIKEVYNDIKNQIENLSLEWAYC